MLQLTAHHKVHLAVAPVDFRNGISGLIALSQQCFTTSPFSGHVFVFRNRRGNAVKLLFYQRNGFWLCQKRFSSGSLAWWPRTLEQVKHLTGLHVQILLEQGQPQTLHLPPAWL